MDRQQNRHKTILLAWPGPTGVRADEHKGARMQMPLSSGDLFDWVIVFGWLGANAGAQTYYAQGERDFFRNEID